MSNENDKEKKEEGLTEEELADVSGGAGAVRTAVVVNGVQAFRTVTRLANGASSDHIESKFGSLPGGGSTVIINAKTGG
jgi:hypothetical protein